VNPEVAKTRHIPSQRVSGNYSLAEVARSSSPFLSFELHILLFPMQLRDSNFKSCFCFDSPYESLFSVKKKIPLAYKEKKTSFSCIFERVKLVLGYSDVWLKSSLTMELKTIP
jgi:hypothetical protein